MTPPPIALELPWELRQLIRRMANENPTWGQERIASELLLKVGLRASPRTVRRLAALRLARHRPGVGHGRERGALDPKSRYTCWMVRPTLARDQASKRSRRRGPGNMPGTQNRAT